MLVVCVCLFLLSQETVTACLNNYVYDSGRSLSWSDGTTYTTTYTTQGFIKPDVTGSLKDWKVKLTFKAPLLADLSTWIVEGKEQSNGRTFVELTPKSYNQVISNTWTLDYIVKFAQPLRNDHLECVEFCGTVVGTGVQLCSDEDEDEDEEDEEDGEEAEEP